MIIFEFSALAASFCFAAGGFLALDPSRQLGVIRFNRIRMLFVGLGLALIAWITGGFSTITPGDFPILLMSGLIGIYLGDSFLFAGLRRVGPRRNSIMFALSAPLTAIAGVLFLDEYLLLSVVIGCITVTAGVIVAIVFGQRKSVETSWDRVDGSIGVGLLFGLLASFGQAGGIILARPLMEDGMDPIAASAVRVSIGCIALIITYELQRARESIKRVPWSGVLLFKTLGSGLFGMGLGMTCVMFALGGAEAGLVATLSSAAPVAMLPMLWLISQIRPAIGAWVGAVVVVGGSALIFLA